MLQFRNGLNLSIFVYLFVCASFNYYLITFYTKYIPGNVYVNTIVCSLAEAVSTWCAGPTVRLLKPRNSITIAFSMCGVFSIGLWLVQAADATGLIPVVILGARFGICAGFGMLYMCTLYYFPSRHTGSVFGICNTVARAITILSPMVAETPAPIPVMSIIISCVVAGALSRLLREPV